MKNGFGKAKVVLFFEMDKKMTALVWHFDDYLTALVLLHVSVICRYRLLVISNRKGYRRERNAGYISREDAALRAKAQRYAKPMIEPYTKVHGKE